MQQNFLTECVLLLKSYNNKPSVEALSNKVCSSVLLLHTFPPFLISTSAQNGHISAVLELCNGNVSGVNPVQGWSIEIRPLVQTYNNNKTNHLSIDTVIKMFQINIKLNHKLKKAKKLLVLYVCTCWQFMTNKLNLCYQ